MLNPDAGEACAQVEHAILPRDFLVAAAVHYRDAWEDLHRDVGDFPELIAPPSRTERSEPFFPRVGNRGRGVRERVARFEHAIEGFGVGADGCVEPLLR